jgi:hypothetical protein
MCLPLQAVNKQDRQYTCKRKFEARSPNHCFRGKAISITHFECVCGLIYPAMRLRLIVLSSVVCPTVPYFSTLSRKRQHFRKKCYWTKNMCIDFLYNVQNCFSFFRRIQWDVNINEYRSSCKVSVLFLSDLKFVFSLKIFGKISNSKFPENPSSGSRVVPCGRTDRYDEANSRYSQFCKRA